MKLRLILLAVTIMTFSSCAIFNILVVGFAVGASGSSNSLAHQFNSLAYQNTSKEYADKYKNQLETDGKLLRSWHHYTVEEKTEQYILKIYYPETKQILRYTTFDTPNLFNKNGLHKEWWDNGQLKTEGAYNINQPIGKWSNYDFETGHLIKSGYYRKGIKEGKWHFYYPKTGRHKAEFNYSNNEKNGPFALYDKEEKVLAKGRYFKGELDHVDWSTKDTVELKSFLINNNDEMRPLYVEKTPSYEGCSGIPNNSGRQSCSDTRLIEYFYKSMQYPSFAREKNLEGIAVVGFTIDDAGRTKNIVVKNGVCDEIKAECIRIVEEMPNWTPATSNGENIAYSFEATFNFSLNIKPVTRY